MNDTKSPNGTNGTASATPAPAPAPAIELKPFDYIAGNIKGRFEHRLTSKCVAFVGKNRRGKTARLETFRLAMTGEHPVGPHGSNLMDLAPEGSVDLHVLLRTGPANAPIQETSYKVEVEGGKATKADKCDRLGLLRAVEQLPDADKLFENMLPQHAMRDLIKMGSTLGREALFRRFGDITAIPTPRGLDANQLKMWNEGLAAARAEKPKADTAEILAQASSWFRKKKLELGRELKALGGLVKEREAKLGKEAAGAEELPNLKKQLDDAKAWEGAAELRAAKAKLDEEAAAYRLKVQPLIEADKPENRAAREAEVSQLDKVKLAALQDLDAVTQKHAAAREALAAELALAHQENATQYKRIVDEFDRLSKETSAATDARIKAGVEAADAQIKKEVFYLTGGEWLMECIHILAKNVDADGHANCLLCGNKCHVETLRSQVEPRVAARRASVEKLYEDRTGVLAAFEKEKEVALLAVEEAKRKALETHKDLATREYEEKENARVELEGKKADAARAYESSLSEYKAWNNTVLEARRTEEQQKAVLKQEYSRIKGSMDQNALALKSVPADYTGPSSAELTATIDALVNAETANRQLDAEVAKLRQLTLGQEMAKVLEQESAKELNQLLTKTAETANAAVNKYMPAGFRAVLDLETAQWTVIGTDGRTHSKKVMAGSEFGALVVVLALAWTEGAPGRYLTLDDEDLAFFDPDNLALLLQALKEACDDGLLTQVFIAWSRPNEIPDDWGQKIFVDGPLAVLPVLDPLPGASTTITLDNGSPLLL